MHITLASDCFVTVSAFDQDATLLAEGYMAAGSYKVYYKAKGGSADAPPTCSMEIYRDHSRPEILLRRNIALPAN